VAERVAATVLDSRSAVAGELERHGRAAVRRRWVRALAPGLVALAVTAAAVALSAAPAWVLLAPGLAVLAGTALAADRARSLGHAHHDTYVVARAGSLVRRREALAESHVIGWNLRASWWQRRAGLTTLAATTAGGPQQVRILDVPEHRAVALASSVLPHVVEQFVAPPAPQPGPPRAVGAVAG
jgi:putative membrane protein